jgi:hypothetical protein
MRRSKVLVVRGIAVLVLVALGLAIANPAAAQALPPPNCTVTVTEVNPGDSSAFNVTSGGGSVTVDPTDLGTGLQSLALAAGPVNATVSIPVFAPGTKSPLTVSYTVNDPSQNADFTLRAADLFHAINIRVQCQASQVCNRNLCVLTQGFWRNHEPWPATSLTLGTVSYSEAQLVTILSEPVRGNGLVSLAKQLIAAKLNQANGACVPTGVAAAIAQADALIGGRVAPPVGTGSLSPSATSALTTILDNYNTGLAPGGPAHCN